MDKASLASILGETLNPVTQKQAEQALLNFETRQSFASLLLSIIGDASLPPNVHLSGVLYLKNFVKKYWASDNERSVLKNSIVGLMLQSTPLIQVHIGDIISHIALFDFPDQWLTLFPELVGKLSPVDFHVNNAILLATHSICKRYRKEFRTDELFLEIKYVLSEFATPLLTLYRFVDQTIPQHINSPNALKVLLNSLLLLNKIFFSLSSQDIPEFFEDNLKEFSQYFQKYLVLKDIFLPNESDEAGLLEKVQTSICEIIHLYALRYEEEFTMLPECVNITLQLLASTPLQTKYDYLISAALNVISVVAQRAQHASFFENPATLAVICEKIIFPNIVIRDIDEELFEDEPLDYVRRDIQGLESESRRKSSEDLIRSLGQLHYDILKPILLHFISDAVKDYFASGRAHWKKKDAAIHVYLAMIIKTLTAARGATALHSSVDISEFMKECIIPDLSQPSCVHPILLIDSIKFCVLLRKFIPDTLVNDLSSTIINLLGHADAGVSTYAAVALDKFLVMKDEAWKVFKDRIVFSSLEPLVLKLFSLMRTANSVLENEFYAKALLRLVTSFPNDLGPFGAYAFDDICRMLLDISGAFKNPQFIYYLFETFASMVKYFYASRPLHAQGELESGLFPLLQTVLGNELTDLYGYVFSILAVVLEFYKGEGVSPNLRQLFEPLLKPAIWAIPATISSLARLIETYIIRDASLLSGHLNELLGIFMAVFSSKATDHIALEFLQAILHKTQVSNDVLKTVFSQILQKAQVRKTPKFQRAVYLFLGSFLSSYPDSASTLLTVLEGIQPGLSKMVLMAFVVNVNFPPADDHEKKILLVGFTNLFGSTSLLDQSQEVWVKILEKVISVHTAVPMSSMSEGGDEEYEEVNVASGRLRSVSSNILYSAVPHLPDSQKLFMDNLSRLLTMRPQAGEAIRGQLSSSAIEFIRMASSHLGVSFTI